MKLKLTNQNFLIAIITIIASISITSCKLQEKLPPAPLEYQIQKEWHPGSYGMGLHLVVDLSTTREQAFQLAEWLKSKYKKNDFLFIAILTDLIAAKNFDNPEYSDEELFKHYLILILRNDKSGHSETTWMKK